MFAYTGILFGLVSSIIMQTILATVLPSVVKDLGDAHLYSWIFSGYLIASTITIPIFAKLADLYGRKRFYLGGMVVFLLGSVLSGTTNSMYQLVLYRAIQGLGAGALAPAAIAMIRHVSHKRTGENDGHAGNYTSICQCCGAFSRGNC